MKKFLKFLLLAFIAVATLFIACNKVDKGFISDNLYYSPRVIIATQGNLVRSESLSLDGSTGPLSVKLLAVKDALTGQNVTADFLKEYKITQFNAAVLPTDTTIQSIKNKISVLPQKTLYVNEIGGQITITQASLYLPLGSFQVDVEASNVKGTKTLTNACGIRILPKKNFTVDSLGAFFTTSDVGSETGFTSAVFLPIKVTYDPFGPNKIRFIYQDKNGVPFDPSAGQVITRGSRGHFSQMNPYYPLVRTSTSLEWEFLELPNGFPMRLGNNGELIYYRIPGEFTVENRNVNPVFGSFKVFSPGTFTVTVKIPTITKKP